MNITKPLKSIKQKEFTLEAQQSLLILREEYMLEPPQTASQGPYTTAQYIIWILQTCTLLIRIHIITQTWSIYPASILARYRNGFSMLQLLFTEISQYCRFSTSRTFTCWLFISTLFPQSIVGISSQSLERWRSAVYKSQSTIKINLLHKNIRDS